MPAEAERDEGDQGRGGAESEGDAGDQSDLGVDRFRRVPAVAEQDRTAVDHHVGGLITNVESDRTPEAAYLTGLLGSAAGPGVVVGSFGAT
jgi:hypothetical protein